MDKAIAKLLIVTVLVCVALDQVATAQSTLMLTGFVQKPGGYPVSGARVTVWSLDRKISADAMTDKRGRYVIKGLQKGWYVVHVKPAFPDALPTEKSVLVSSGTTTAPIIRLEMNQDVDH